MEDFFKSRIVAYAVLVVVGITGVADINMAINPTARPDPNTGEDGRARDKLIAKLRADMDAIIVEDGDIWEQVNKLEHVLERHLEYSENKVNEITQFQATCRERMAALKEKVGTLHEVTKECMRRTAN